jgi:peptidase S24-like family protein
LTFGGDMFKPEKLKERRLKLGLRQVDILKKLNVSKQAYSAWEKGKIKPSQDNLKKLEIILEVPEGYFTELEIATLYKKLNKPNQQKAKIYVEDLLETQKSKVQSIKKERYEYHVYEKMSAGIGASIYGDVNYDTVYFDEEFAHDFASWVSGDSMEPKYQNGSVALIRETGFDYDGAVYAVVCNSQTYIKRVFREEDGLRLVSINQKYKDIFIPYEDDPRVVGIIVGNFVPLEE